MKKESVYPHIWELCICPCLIYLQQLGRSMCAYVPALLTYKSHAAQLLCVCVETCSDTTHRLTGDSFCVCMCVKNVGYKCISQNTWQHGLEGGRMAHYQLLEYFCEKVLERHFVVGLQLSPGALQPQRWSIIMYFMCNCFHPRTVSLCVCYCY